MKVATELSPMVGDLSVPTPPSPDRPHLGPAVRRFLLRDTAAIIHVSRRHSHPMTFFSDITKTQTRDASQVLTRVNQQVQIRPIAEAHIRFSSQEYAKADTGCLPRNGGSRKERDTHNDAARDDRTWGDIDSLLYAGTHCSRPAICHVLSCIFPLIPGRGWGCRDAHDSIWNRVRHVLDTAAETTCGCKQRLLNYMPC